MQGVLIINNSGDYSYLKPDGPLENDIFSVETLNNKTWVSYSNIQSISIHIL